MLFSMTKSCMQGHEKYQNRRLSTTSSNAFKTYAGSSIRFTNMTNGSFFEVEFRGVEREWKI